MSEHGDRDSEVSSERVSALNAAILGARFDLGVVLREAIDAARALTGARCGVIVTVDRAGMPQDFVTSGLTAEEQRRLVGAPADGLRLFEHLRDVAGPVRVVDWPDYVGALGLSPDIILGRTVMGLPLRCCGEDLGLFFLADKDRGDAFGDECEKTLEVFAAQAANALAYARAWSDEQRARADLEALIDISPVGVVVFRRSGAAPLLNREARRLLGALWDPGLSAAALLEALRVRRPDGRELTRHDILAGETLRGEEIEISVPDGRSVTVLANATPVRSRHGEIESALATLQDLAPVERLRRSRVEFLSMVSHELRVPLTSIKGSAASAQRGVHDPDPGELRQFLRIIEEQADRIDDLIGDLLDAGRIEMGTVSVKPVPMQVAGLAEEARTVLLSAGARHRIVIDVAPELPAVMAHGRRIVQVLTNLLSNAAKHSPENSPIRVGAERDGAHVAVSVCDEGEGIPAGRLAQLFRRRAAMEDRDRAGAGAGLGLVICRGLVEAHGGRIRAESAGAGHGARFTFTLPLAAQARAERGDSHASPPARDRTPVLAVDDDPEMLRYLRRTLSAAGYEPLLTGDPREVGAIVRKRRPRLALLDLMLPGTDGIELMGRVAELADLPVIFISAYGRDETVARALEAGAVDYIVKPFSATELTARVRAALRRGAEPDSFVLGDLAIDYERRAVSVAGRPVRLTPTEYRLLRVLSMNAGRVMPYASLLRQVWAHGNDDDTEPVRGFVKKLRRKLGDDPTRPTYIANERGVGYRMPRPQER